MKDTWTRYHLIGDCLRNHLPQQVSNHVAEKISEELKQEPTVLSPNKAAARNTKPLIGFAIAASVALVAILGIQRGNETNLNPGVPVAVDQTNTSTPSASGFSFPETPVLPAAVTKSDTPESVANQRMNNYLMNYNEYRSSGGMNGIPPYVRIVTIETQE